MKVKEKTSFKSIYFTSFIKACTFIVHLLKTYLVSDKSYDF